MLPLMRIADVDTLKAEIFQLLKFLYDLLQGQIRSNLSVGDVNSYVFESGCRGKEDIASQCKYRTLDWRFVRTDGCDRKRSGTSKARSSTKIMVNIE